jgi:hypothetical protein
MLVAILIGLVARISNGARNRLSLVWVDIRPKQENTWVE